VNFYKVLDLGFDDMATDKRPLVTRELPDDMPESLIMINQLIIDLQDSARIEIKTTHKNMSRRIM